MPTNSFDTGSLIGTAVAHADAKEDVIYSTYWVNLTKDDVMKLKMGDKELCAVGSLIWKDATGTYDTYMYNMQCSGRAKTAPSIGGWKRKTILNIHIRQHPALWL